MITDAGQQPPVLSENLIRAWIRVVRRIIAPSGPMLAILDSLGMFVAD
jgi:hypothetical protein